MNETAHTAARTPEFAEPLRNSLTGQARFDPGTRALYATDASNYRRVPRGVVFPRDDNDVAATLEVAREYGLPITSRGSGTSVAGNAMGDGLVLDFSKHMNRIEHVDPARRLARVQPGVVLDTLRETAGRHGLTFGPDPSTHSRCTLGGMIGNNSCGTHSVAWGKTVDNVRELDVLLSDGTRLTLSSTDRQRLDALCGRQDRTGRLYRGLRDLVDEFAPRLRTDLPDTTRRVSGYNLDQLLPENGFDVARALVGSEGSCATVLSATVELVEEPGARAMVVLGFDDVYAAADRVPRIREHPTLAVEGLTRELVDVVRERNPNSPALTLLPRGRSWLLVETGGPDPDTAARAAHSIAERFADHAECVVHTDARRMAALWKIREEGSGYSTRMTDGSQRWSGWEDAAVPPENLGSYLREFDELLDRFGYRGASYGHYGEGCIHVRIDFDLTSRSGASDYRAFLEAAADLVVAHGGSLSGEHGDGQARSELLPRMYPPEMLEAFDRFKTLFDPEGLHNPGVITRPRGVDEDLRPLVAAPRIPSRTELALHSDNGDLASATHRCVGVGKCLNPSGGVMCPSYRATRDEKHSTRGRAHLLSEMLSGRTVVGGWRSEQTREALDLCLSCKGCKTDCPVGVDMATYKAEFLHRHYRHRPRPATHYSMGFLPLWLAAARWAPGLFNRLGRGRAAPLLKRLGGIAPERDLPLLARRGLLESCSDRQASRPPEGPGDPVLLFPDTFTNHFEPGIGLDAIAVLESSGHEVRLPDTTVCCGLTWYSTGQLGTARRTLRRTARELRPWLREDAPVVGLEPSCTAFLRNDALELAPADPDVRSLASATRTFAEQVDQHAPARPSAPRPAREQSGEVLVQMHCHQYSELGFDADRSVLETAGLNPRVLDAGCCGLAGNFGFERGHYEVSMACAEDALLPRIRSAPDGTEVLADGFSCRTQLRHAAAAEPLHLATALARQLGVSHRNTT
ncbi:FAD/FMN-containing dehydrogenase/Fe-S oxidoreductase [Actinopolyspora biskrensis]|uniref:FAD/FMN-containing dehydrogenase/Fe-S oxidoreductase n=1 Tax=Actinopolyspora biskrensis TaxID=1470178 RepID=A0A852YUZ1_9ACTN|nr:FAD-binding and (Fe-S)-binding domain-containing protein [Actinopolyspora biskrensis]NYH77880.1 FAD/FMN-containing dehydrogenase/Fe-S oxidoreductase [Actinopolyspora biskrensis]